MTLIIVIPFVGYNLSASKSTSRQVLSEQTTQHPINPSPIPKAILVPTPSPDPTRSPPQPSKSTYTITLIGDSMVDTMGENLDYLEQNLKSRYPKTQFKLYNYGIGGQNVAQGLARFNQSFSNGTRNYPPLSQLKADIIIVGSFAYNPFSPHNRDQHWLTLSQLINLARQASTQIYLLSEIAPLKTGFGQGPGGINWPENLASQQAANIIEQLENAVALSQSKGIPLINAFAHSQNDGKFGQRIYVSSHDNIHPSEEGHRLMAELIARTIKLP